MGSLIGKSLGRYEILEELGEGGMAVVYRANDSRLDRDVAIKVIRKGAFPADHIDRILKRFEREAKALARLSHPNIMKVLDYGEHEGSPFLVMEYLPGGTLKKKMGKPMQWEKAIQLILPIAEALDYAHTQNMIHRDVKPSNILLTQRGQPMLTDFGIAKILDLEETQDLTGTNMAMGTPEYMAPEQATAKFVDHRADIYALGIVLYEMVTGRKPFTADTPLAVLFKHASDPLPAPNIYVADLPDGVEKILLKMLAKKPEDRYQSMDELQKALEKLLDSGKHPAVIKKPIQAAKKTTEAKRETSTLSLQQNRLKRQPATIRTLLLSLAGIIVLVLIGLTLFKNPLQDETNSATPAIERIQESQTSTSIAHALPDLPVGMGTPVPMPIETITAENVGHVEELARWGKGEVNNFAYSPDGKLLAIASSIGIYIYDANSLEETLFIETPNSVSQVVFTGDNQQVIFIQQDTKEIFVHNVSDGSLAHTLKGQDWSPRSISYSPSNKLLAVEYTGLDGGLIYIFDIASGKTLQVINAYSEKNPGISMAFSHDGKTLVYAESDHKEVNFWDIDSGRVTKKINSSDSGVHNIALSPDGTLLASYVDEVIQIWEISSGHLLQSLDMYFGTGSLSFSSDGSKVLIESQIFSLADGKTIVGLGTSGKRPVSYSPDESILTSVSGGTIKFWNANNGSYRGEIPGFDEIGQIVLSPDGQILASVNGYGGNRTINLHRISDGNISVALRIEEDDLGDHFDNIAFSQDGKLLAAHKWSGNTFVWQTDNGTLIWEIDGDEEIMGIRTSWILNMRFDDSDNLMAYVHVGKTIKVLNLPTGTLMYTLNDVDEQIRYSSISPDGRFFAARGAYSPQYLKLWRVSDSASPQVLGEGHSDTPAFSFDGELLAAQDGDGLMRIWKVVDGSKLGAFEEIWGNKVSSSFSLDKSLLVVDGQILRLLDFSNIGKLGADMKYVVFSLDGKLMFSVGYDSTIRVWGIPPE
jgi:WD40 repeat protein/tRNA A-37 threonylcarbamoyl transferase component Bud32